MTLSQLFMIVQVITCGLGALGFAWDKQPWMALVWGMYAFANVGWFMLATGGK